MGAERNIARRLALLEPFAGEEPLPQLLDQRDLRHGCIAQSRGEFHNRLEFGVIFQRIGLETLDCAQALCLVVETGGGFRRRSLRQRMV